MLLKKPAVCCYTSGQVNNGLCKAPINDAFNRVNKSILLLSSLETKKFKEKERQEMLKSNLKILSLFIFVAANVFSPFNATAQNTSSGPNATEPETSPAAVTLPADEEEQDSDIEELERRIDVLAEEIERLRSGEPEIEVTDERARALGVAPSAAGVYRTESGFSIAGYGEMLIENYADTRQNGTPSGATTKSDFLRHIIYTGYRFNDKFLFNSEIEIEHAKEAYVEFAYLDYQMNENFGLRGGMLLIPMGLVNEFHEPTVFFGAERPVTEQKIIPSTWRENGGGFYGAFDKVNFRVYVVNGFNGAKFASSGLRGGRQKGGKAKSENMAITGRLDFAPTPGVFLGGSFYSGGSAQGQVEDKSVNVSIFDLHAQAQIRGFDVRALYATANLGDIVHLNDSLGLVGAAAVGDKMQGGYVQVGYNLLSQVPAAGNVALTPYVRLEKVDTQASMQSGYSRSLSTNNRYTVLGIELKPISNIVLKIDHMWVDNEAQSGINQFNVNLGYAF